jgi:translation elongation factor EF-1beta
LKPIAYGLQKLVIMCHIVDDLVSTDDLEEQIQQVAGVGGTDIVSFSKL